MEAEVGCTFSSFLSQLWQCPKPESSCSYPSIRAKEVAVVTMPDFCLTFPCCLCCAASLALCLQPSAGGLLAGDLHGQRMQ